VAGCPAAPRLRAAAESRDDATVFRMPARSNTRQRLIDAAIVIMDDKGPGRLRLRDVADAVGIKEPSVYKFFENRDALISAAGATRYARGIREMGERFALIAGQTTTREEFSELIRQTVVASTAPERVEDRAGRVVAIGMALSRPDMAAKIRQVQAEANAQVAKGLRHGVAHGWVRDDVPLEILAYWATSVVSGRVFLELDPEQANAPIWDGLTTDALLAVIAPR
jgi:AcrR family transcriptional regulator